MGIDVEKIQEVLSEQPDPAWVAAYLPDSRKLPGWVEVERREDGAKYWHATSRMTAILSGFTVEDKKWLHLSVAHTHKVPSYADLAKAKRYFLGEDKLAAQVFARDSDHVNINEYCLHLWVCLDEDCLPDFTFGGRSI